MLTHTDLKKGTQFIYENQPWEVLEYSHLKMAQRRPVVQTKIKNLITGSVQEKNFQQGDIFEESGLFKKSIKFLYSNKGEYWFCLPPHQNQTSTNKFEKEDNIDSFWCGGEKIIGSKRFSFTENQIGKQAKFFKPNSLVEGLIFNDKIINVSAPIKVQLKVKEAPPGIKGDRAQGGTKEAILESGAAIQVPLFIEEGDIIEINTELGEYVKRV